MCCVPLAVPAFVVCSLFRSTIVTSPPKHLAPNTDIGENVLLQAFDRRVTESMAHDSPLTRMLHLVDRRVYTNCLRGAWKCFIEARLANIATEAIDSLQSSRSVDGEQVWSESYIGSILDMCTVESKMSASFVRIIG
jgi:hypothetical protein